MRSGGIRFTGMASGMDTDSIVKDMMRPQQYKIDNQKKQQALLQLKQDAWKDMNKKLYDFHTKYTDKMRNGSAFNKNNISSSNTDVISVDKNAVVPEGTHQFEVISLAESATAIGQVSGDWSSEGDPTLTELMDGLTVPKEVAIEVNGKEVKVKVKGTDQLSDVAKALNEELKGEGFRASYDAKSGSFFINSTGTGEGQKIQFSSNNNKGAKLFQKMGFETDGPIRGKDAQYTYNGSSKPFTSATNKIEINGITTTLKAVGSATISSAPDPDAIYSWVKEFVTEYNELIDEINTKIDTKPGKDIMPLTAEERESMSDSEIKLWEEKLNDSIFYKDQQLSNFVDSARRILGQVLEVGNEEDPNSLASLGIVTGSWQEKGKLHIEGDEDDPLYADKENKLKAAIEKDPTKVTKLFTDLGKELYAEHNKTLTSSNKLKSAMNFYNDKVMTDKMKEFDKQISTLEERMYRMEDMQYAKFAAMEQMLHKLNSQGDWLAQQFGGY